MIEKDKYTSEFKYNPLNPKYWTLLCKINFIISILLIIDWIIGTSLNLDIIRRSYLAMNFSEIDFFSSTLPIIIFITVLVSSFLLNDELESTPFYGSIIIKILLDVGASYYTYLGTICNSIITLCLSIAIVVTLVFVILFETEEPPYYIRAMLIGVSLLSASLLVEFLLYGLWIKVIWGVIYIGICLVSILMISKKVSLKTTIPLLAFAILNDYIFSFGLSGFDVGSELIRFCVILLFIKSFSE